MTQQFPIPAPDLEGSECPCPECVDLRATRASACADCLSMACHYWQGPGCIQGCPCHAGGDSGDMMNGHAGWDCDEAGCPGCNEEVARGA